MWVEMTATTETFDDWGTRPVGKLARGAVAVLGSIFAVLVLMTAGLVESGSWALVVLGVALAATSVRVAQRLTMVRILALGATILAVPLAVQIF